jgi:S1-C subfamily serine protease
VLLADLPVKMLPGMGFDSSAIRSAIVVQPGCAPKDPFDMTNKSNKLVFSALAFVFFTALSFASIAQSTNIRRSHQNGDNSLKDRYSSLVCAIVLITTERGSGTGFFVDKDGDMVTAAHVISTKNFNMNSGQVDFDVKVDEHINIMLHGQQQSPLDSTKVDVDKNESATDLAYIRTGAKPPCWIPLGDSTKTATGDHLLSIGFPGIDNGNPILYEGFLSGRFRHPPSSVIAVVNGTAISPKYEVLKVQMPITPGASGSPVIDDSGQAVGVVSEAPMIWTQDLENISKLASSGRGSGVLLSGFDTTKILGQLAVVVHEFETTGSGYAVPVSGLKSTRH